MIATDAGLERVAVNLHGLPRTTEDLDLFVAPDAKNIERLKAALPSVFDDDSIAAITADDLLGANPAVRHIPPTGSFHIDILTRLREAFQFRDLAAQRVELEGVEITVATPPTLYEMKKDTVGPRDRGDAERLARAFDLERD